MRTAVCDNVVASRIVPVPGLLGCPGMESNIASAAYNYSNRKRHQCPAACSARFLFSAQSGWRRIEAALLLFLEAATGNLMRRLTIGKLLLIRS